MKLLKIKTARFSQIIERCDKPEVYTLWQTPSADRHLQAQIKKTRVMTILKSESGIDFGIVGFKESREARYLIFPKSLKRFAEQRSVRVGRFRKTGNRLLRHNQDMYWRLGIHVVKRNRVIIFPNDFSRDL